MKLKELQSLMQDIQPFTKPKVELEQYPTGAHLASRMLYTVENNYNEFEGRMVIDLGCGTGMLTIGAAMLGSRHVLGIDIDPDALEVAVQNVEQFEEEDSLPIDFLMCDIPALMGGNKMDPENLPGEESPSTLLRQLSADVVLMNPPFGTKRKGVDMEFLRVAFALSKGTVYSLHKSSTRQYIQKLAERELRAASCEVLAELRYDLPATMKFHKQKSMDIEVDLWRFEVGSKEQ